MRYLSLLAVMAPACVYGAQPAQIYLSTAPATTNGASPLHLTAPQANAVLAHHLGVAQYERLPTNRGDRKWEQALASNAEWGNGAKMVILMECSKDGCDDFIPDVFSNRTPYTLPSLPVRSWTSVVTLHLHRLAASLGLDLDSSAIWGLDSFVEGIKSVDGWMGWVGEELGAAIGWEGLKKSVKAAVETQRQNSRLLTDLNLLDPATGETLVMELESLASLADSFAGSASADNGPQSESAQVVALHLKGMTAIAAAHSRSSAEYKRAAALLRATLSATLAAFESSSSTPTIILLTLPPYSAPLLSKRSPWLTPFEAMHRYTRTSPMANQKRASSEIGRVIHAAAATPSPVVPSSSICFKSAEDVNNQTANCLGRGVPVIGVTARKGGDCWVCSCSPTTEGGFEIDWAGQGCEKIDVSSQFVLLLFSGIGLLLVLYVSVMLLYSVGSAELPSVLAAVGGTGSMKMD